MRNYFIGFILAIGIVFGYSAYANLNVHGQLVSAMFELLGSDPTGTEGRFYYNIVEKKAKIYNGTTWEGFGGSSSSSSSINLPLLEDLTAGTIVKVINDGGTAKVEDFNLSVDLGIFQDGQVNDKLEYYYTTTTIKEPDEVITFYLTHNPAASGIQYQHSRVGLNSNTTLNNGTLFVDATYKNGCAVYSKKNKNIVLMYDSSTGIQIRIVKLNPNVPAVVASSAIGTWETGSNPIACTYDVSTGESFFSVTDIQTGNPIVRSFFVGSDSDVLTVNPSHPLLNATGFQYPALDYSRTLGKVVLAVTDLSSQNSRFATYTNNGTGIAPTFGLKGQFASNNASFGILSINRTDENAVYLFPRTTDSDKLYGMAVDFGPVFGIGLPAIVSSTTQTSDVAATFNDVLNKTVLVYHGAAGSHYRTVTANGTSLTYDTEQSLTYALPSAGLGSHQASVDRTPGSTPFFTYGARAISLYRGKFFIGGYSEYNPTNPIGILLESGVAGQALDVLLRGGVGTITGSIGDFGYTGLGALTTIDDGQGPIGMFIDTDTFNFIGSPYTTP